MKKVLFSLLAVTAMFTACNNDDGTPDVNISITQDMVEVDGVTGDYLVVVDQSAKTIAIELSYEDADELQALTVNFVNLPSGVTAESLTHNFSDGATAQAVFTKDGVDVTYTVSATVADANPHFVTATLNGVEVSGGTVKLSGSADLETVVFEYTVAPEGTVVTIGDTEVTSGSEVDFSDKVNGVTFTLTCNGVSNEETIKVTTTGISSVTRVWGHYVAPKTTTDDWYGTAVAAAGWERTIAMDDNYVYMGKASAGAAGGCYAISISDPSQVTELSMNGVMTENCFWSTNDANVIDNGDESILLLSNMANAAGQHLCVYAYSSVDADPEMVLDYTLTQSDRLGDRFTVEGDWQDGRLVFFNYMGTSPRNAYVFNISAGKVSATPEIINLDTTLGGLGQVGCLFKYSDSEYLWAGGGNATSGASVYTVSGNTFTQSLYCTTAINMPSPIHGVNFFTFNEQEYIAFVSLILSYNDATLRIFELNSDTLLESIENNNSAESCYVLGLGDPEDMEQNKNNNGNATMDAAVRVINGETYIAAMSSNHGVSLFRLE